MFDCVYMSFILFIRSITHLEQHIKQYKSWWQTVLLLVQIYLSGLKTKLWESSSHLIRLLPSVFWFGKVCPPIPVSSVGGVPPLVSCSCLLACFPWGLGGIPHWMGEKKHCGATQWSWNFMKSYQAAVSPSSHPSCTHSLAHSGFLKHSRCGSGNVCESWCVNGVDLSIHL